MLIRQEREKQREQRHRDRDKEIILSKYVKHEGKWVFIAFVLQLFFKWFKCFQIRKERKG